MNVRMVSSVIAAPRASMAAARRSMAAQYFGVNGVMVGSSAVARTTLATGTPRFVMTTSSPVATSSSSRDQWVVASNAPMTMLMSPE